MSVTTYLKVGAIALTSLLSTIAFGLQSDSEKPMQIVADSWDMNRSSGVSVYRTNVEIDQGTTHIRGDTLTTYNDEHNKLAKAVIKGKGSELAHYRTLSEENKPELFADAMTITFYSQKRYVVLQGQAKIQQGDDVITGERLEYDLNSKQLKAPAQEGEHPRATIVIKPESIAGNKTTHSNKNS